MENKKQVSYAFQKRKFSSRFRIGYNYISTWMGGAGAGVQVLRCYHRYDSLPRIVINLCLYESIDSFLKTNNIPRKNRKV